MYEVIPDAELAGWYADASRDLAEFTGLSLPEPTDRLRRAPVVRNPRLGLDHARGVAFYPCCGRDTQHLRRNFAAVCDAMVLADPFHPRPRDIERPGHSIRQVGHIGHVVKLDDVPEPVRSGPFTRYADDGLATFCRAVDDLAVFYYRGDSMGGGGSDQRWLGAVLFQAVIFSLPEDGLIVTDGSNCTISHALYDDDELPWSALAGRRRGRPRRIGDLIRWRHVELECVHEEAQEPQGGVYTWRVRMAGEGGRHDVEPGAMDERQGTLF